MKINILIVSSYIKHILSVLILFSCMSSYAQKIEFAGEVNGATFRMSDAKRFQQEFADSLPFPTKVVRNFPSSVGYGGRVSLRVHRFDILIFGTFNSAKSEIKQTGTISLLMFFQQHATVLNVGLGTGYRLSAKAQQKIAPYVGVRIGMGQTKFGTRDRRVIDSMIIVDETNYF